MSVDLKFEKGLDYESMNNVEKYERALVLKKSQDSVNSLKERFKNIEEVEFLLFERGEIFMLRDSLNDTIQKIKSALDDGISQLQKDIDTEANKLFK